MTNDIQFRKEVQDRKNDYQEKRVELISRLCADTTPVEKKDDRLKKDNQK